MRFTRTLVSALLLLALVSSAQAWAPGTHILIVNHLNTGLKSNPANLNFGAISPDLNQVLSSNQNSEFFTATHYDYMPMWQAARKTGAENQLALAYGWMSHNEDWGADHFAHIASTVYPNFVNPFPEYSGQNGYVWKKSTELCQLMTAQVTAYGIPDVAEKYLSGPAGLMNCHFIVEYGMDLLVRQAMDPQIGAEIKAAAASHDRDAMAALLISAYRMPSQEKAGAPMGAVMAGGADGWAYLMGLYGEALSKTNDREAFIAVSDFLASLAGQLLGVEDPQLNLLIQIGLQDSMQLCAPDLGLELNGTIKHLQQQMNIHRMKN
jgi:hypothetical protein